MPSTQTCTRILPLQSGGEYEIHFAHLFFFAIGFCDFVSEDGGAGFCLCDRRFPDVIVHRLLCGILEHNGGFLCLPSQGNRNPVEGGHEFGVYKNSLRLYPIPDEHSEILLRKVGIPLEIEQVEVIYFEHVFFFFKSCKETWREEQE